MENLSRAARRLLLLLAMTSGLLVVGSHATVSSVAAGHETRVTDIQESGIDVWIMALTIAGVVVMLVAFAAIVLIWEHNDEEEEHGAESGPVPKTDL